MKPTTAFLVVLSSVLFAGTLKAQDAMDKKIRELLNIQGTSKQYEIVIDQMIAIQKKELSDILDDQWWDLMAEKMKKRGVEDIYNIVIPIYKKHLTESDIDAIIAFYKSDAGQSLLSKTPLILEESMQMGAEWGAKLGKEIADEIIEEYEQEEKKKQKKKKD